MRSVWIRRHGGPEVLEVRESPEPVPGPGEVRVRIRAAGLTFSDIMATGVEFFQQPPGTGRLMADYFLGEDLSFVFDPPRRAVRSLENPSLFCSAALGVCDADHYSRRYRGALDNGGVHHNCGIAGQAFYLLIEGGTNRTSGQHVGGLGAANRDRAERIRDVRQLVRKYGEKPAGWTKKASPAVRMADRMVRVPLV
jgi:hypothetical protein